MKKSKIISQAAMFLLLIAIVGGISALHVRAAEVTGTLSSDLGATSGSIGGSVGGSTVGGTIGGGVGGSTVGGTVGGGVGGSTVGGTLGGGVGGGGTIGGTVGGGGGSSSSGGGSRRSSGGSSGGSVLGASTGGTSGGTTGDNPGEVLGASTGPGFPATGLGPTYGAGNIAGALLMFASLVIYGFYRRMETPKKRRARLLLLSAALLAFASGLYIILNNAFFSDPNLIPEENNYVPSYSGEFPVRLKIPSIGVDAPVIPVGKTKAGTMDVPTKPMDTGWYRLGPKPGEIGSAVIAGHRGFRSGPAVFDNLHNMKSGDEVHVLDEKGRELVFIVREIHTYGATEQVPDVWEKNDRAHLNLITCFGKWNRLRGTSDERLVVFTDIAS